MGCPQEPTTETAASSEHCGTDCDQKQESLTTSPPIQRGLHSLLLEKKIDHIRSFLPRTAAFTNGPQVHVGIDTSPPTYPAPPIIHSVLTPDSKSWPKHKHFGVRVFSNTAPKLWNTAGIQKGPKNPPLPRLRSSVISHQDRRCDSIHCSQCTK